MRKNKYGYKKKHIYSKIKKPYIETNKKLENPMQMIGEIFNIKNVWSDFIDKAMFQELPIDVDYHKDLRNILKNIKDTNIKGDLIGRLMDIKEYNPFKDNIPTDKLPQNLRNMIIKIENLLLNEPTDKLEIIDTTEFEHNKQDLSTKYVYYNNRKLSYCALKESTTNIGKDIFKENIDFYIAYNDGKFIISSNPKLKDKRPNFTFLFDKLQSIEPDIWYLHGNKGMLLTLNGMKSNIDNNSIIKLMQQCNYEP